MKYIHELETWPHFSWDEKVISLSLAKTRHHQGRLLGLMSGLGFDLQNDAILKALTQEVLKSNEIEGERLDKAQVRSSLARKMGIDDGGFVPIERHVEGVVEMMLDATRNFEQPLTEERLFGWHAALFPSGRSGMTKIEVGQWRTDQQGPMQVVSGAVGKEQVHFQAPPARSLSREMKAFFTWLKDPPNLDPVLVAAIAHLWFITLHPFDDGNGRIARAITELALARSEQTAKRFYSLSAQICLDRKGYYQILEDTQSGDLDITAWLSWFLKCLSRAFEGAEMLLKAVLKKAEFWEQHKMEPLNERQRKILNRLLDGFEGNLTSSKWATLGKCSQDTASRDIEALVSRGILIKNPGGGRSTSYSLRAFSLPHR